jgi:hypothetical protein
MGTQKLISKNFDRLLQYKNWQPSIESIKYEVYDYQVNVCPYYFH